MTPLILSRCTGARIDRAERCLPALLQAMALYGIDTKPRQAMFLANIGHETGGLKWLSEIWGPTPAQRRYERDFAKPWPRSVAESKLPEFAVNRLAYTLGNTAAGDGEFFKGHAMLQTTGRYNHAITRDRLRARFPHMDIPDFELEPDKLAEPQWAALAAGEYVAMKDANSIADAGDFDGYCDLINKGRKTIALGDTNGYADRAILFAAGMAALP